MNHTPGPWKAVTTDEDITTMTIIDENNYWIARVLNFDTDVDDIVESKANARLIATAPKLLKALKIALETIKYLDEDYDERESYVQGIKVIAEAEYEHQ